MAPRNRVAAIEYWLSLTHGSAIEHFYAGGYYCFLANPGHYEWIVSSQSTISGKEKEAWFMGWEDAKGDWSDT